MSNIQNYGNVNVNYQTPNFKAVIVTDTARKSLKYSKQLIANPWTAKSQMESEELYNSVIPFLKQIKEIIPFAKNSNHYDLVINSSSSVAIKNKKSDKIFSKPSAFTIEENNIIYQEPGAIKTYVGSVNDEKTVKELAFSLVNTESENPVLENAERILKLFKILEESAEENINTIDELLKVDI